MGNMAIKIIIVTICIILSYTKKSGLWLNTLNTFFHESFHALVSLILGNKVKEIKFEETTEGSCISLSKSKFRTFLSSLAGYIGCSLISLLFIFCIAKGFTHWLIIGITIYSFFILLFYIRNTYALVWTICFSCINLALTLFPTSVPIEKLIIFIYTTLILIDNTKACFTILHLSFFKAKKSGDCNLLHKVTKIPAFVWGIVFNLVNAFVIYKVLKLVFLENYI